MHIWNDNEAPEWEEAVNKMENEPVPPYYDGPPIPRVHFPRAISRLYLVMRELENGQVLRLKGLPYPIAMGEDGSIGYLYEPTNSIPSAFTIPQLLKLMHYMPPIIYSKDGLIDRKRDK